MNTGRHSSGAVKEVHRLSNCFDGVRNLVGLERPARDISSFSLSALVTDVLQNLGSNLAIGGIAVLLDVRANENPMSVLVDASRSRVFSAVRLVLTTLADCLDPGDQIKIFVETDGLTATIRFQTPMHAQPDASKERDLLLTKLSSQLEYAQVLVASVGGEIRFDATPDLICVSLPAAPQPGIQNSPGRALHV